MMDGVSVLFTTITSGYPAILDGIDSRQLRQGARYGVLPTLIVPLSRAALAHSVCPRRKLCARGRS